MAIAPRAFASRVAAIVLPLCLTGCTGVRLNEGDDGSTVTLPIGDTVRITLSSNPTTGFAWQVAELDENILEETEQRYVAVPSMLVGSSGVELWEFTARAEGTTTLRMEYRRSFKSPDVDPERTFELTVTVTADGE